MLAHAYDFSFTGCFCWHIFELYLFFISLNEGDYPSNISFQINLAPCLYIGDGHPAEGGPRQFGISHFLVIHGNQYSLERKHDRSIDGGPPSRQMCVSNVKCREAVQPPCQ